MLPGGLKVVTVHHQLGAKSSRRRVLVGAVALGRHDGHAEAHGGAGEGQALP